MPSVSSLWSLHREAFAGRRQVPVLCPVRGRQQETVVFLPHGADSLARRRDAR